MEIKSCHPHTDDTCTIDHGMFVIFDEEEMFDIFIETMVTLSCNGKIACENPDITGIVVKVLSFIFRCAVVINTHDEPISDHYIVVPMIDHCVGINSSVIIVGTHNTGVGYSESDDAIECVTGPTLLDLKVKARVSTAVACNDDISFTSGTCTDHDTEKHCIGNVKTTDACLL